MENNDSLIGQNIDGYHIDALLGRGGMGRVYRALDIKLDRYAAIKVMSPAHNTESYRKRFDREAQAIAKLKHPHIVAIYRFNEIGDIYYMAMEYVDGADLRWILREYVKKGQLIDYDTILQIVRQISSALDYAHEQGVIHRDIKPSNIMIARDGTAILTDFGLALDVQEGTGGEIFGSPYYIAPEQAVSSAQAVPTTDFYSLGVILFEMLTGSVPFDAESAMQVAMAHISDPLPDPLTINPELHPSFVKVVRKMLDKEPDKRYTSGEALVAALEAAITDAKQADSMPNWSSIGSPKDYIAMSLPPLPAPLNAEKTKPETQMARADKHSTKAVAPPSNLKALQKKSRPSDDATQRNRTLQWGLPVLVIVIVGIIWVAQMTNNADSIAEVSVNDMIQIAHIEGQVTEITELERRVIVVINGQSIQIDRGMPLHALVNPDETETMRIEGIYRLEDDTLRFTEINYAEHNGEAITPNEPTATP